jgi:hypothetical protein
MKSAHRNEGNVLPVFENHYLTYIIDASNECISNVHPVGTERGFSLMKQFA